MSGGDLHPNDLALLYDRLDDRLAPRALDELERRLAEEPALKSAYDDLLTVRARLAALPTRALPSDFLERVRAKAGFPAATPAASSSNAPARTRPTPAAPALPIEAPTAQGDVARGSGAATDPASDAGTPPATSDPATAGTTGAPVLRLVSAARWAYAAAAVVVVGLGAYVFSTIDDRGRLGALVPDGERESARATPDAGRGRTERSSGDAPLDARLARDAEASSADPVKGVARRERDRAGSSGNTSDGAGPFGRPVGAIAPGAREASDDPRPRLAGASAPIPAGPPPAVASGASAASGGRARPNAPDAPASAPAPSPRAARPAASPAPVPPSEATPMLGRRRKDAGAGDGTLADEAFDGADRVFVVYADSFDAARAEVALLVDAARRGTALDASRVRVAPARRAERHGAASAAPAPEWEGAEKRLADDPDATPTEAGATKAKGPAGAEPGPVPDALPLPTGSPDDATAGATGRPASADAPAAGSPPPPGAPLGSFLVDVDDASLERLSLAAGPSDVERSPGSKEAKKTSPPAGADAPTPSPPPPPSRAPTSPAPVTPPAPPSSAPTDDDAPSPRRVRFVVLPR